MSFFHWLPAGLLMALGNAVAAEPSGDSCVDCHGDPGFFSTNKKLYNYFQEWKDSPHQQAGVTCVDCHGGSRHQAEKNAAHGSAIGHTSTNGTVACASIPVTCGKKCHSAVYEGFQKSAHFRKVRDQEEQASRQGGTARPLDQEIKGPVCVTCHGSINSRALNVNTVNTACAHCHNPTTQNNPAVTEKAEKLLRKLLVIQRFQRYVRAKGLASDQAFLTQIDARLKVLSQEWHAVDLQQIENQSQSLLDELKARRDEIKNRPASAKP